MPYDESFEDLPRRAPKLQMDEIDLWAEDLFQDPELQDGLLTAADPMEFIYWYVSETALSLSKAEQSKVARRIYQMMRGEHTASVDGTHRTAETLGETYPDAYVYVHSSGVAFFCNVRSRGRAPIPLTQSAASTRPRWPAATYTTTICRTTCA